MKNILLILLFTGWLSGKAQAKLPDAFTIMADTEQYTDVPDNCWQYMVIVGNNDDIRKITQPGNTAKFTYMGSKYPVFDSKYNVWLRYRIKNGNDHDLQVTVPAMSRKVNIFVKENNTWRVLQTGPGIPWSRKNGLKQLNNAVYTLAPRQEITFYEYRKNVTDANTIDPKIGSYKNIIQQFYLNKTVYNSDDLLNIALFGFICFAAVFNLFFFYINRERVYLVYSITLIIAALKLSSDIISYYIFKESPDAAQIFEFCIAFSMIFMVLVTIRAFLNIRAYYPVWDRVFAVLPTLMFLTALILNFIPKVTISGNHLVENVLQVLIGFYIISLITIICLMLKKNKDTQLFVVAALPFLAALLQSIFLDYDWTIPVSIIWTIAVLSWGMFARFKNLMILNARIALEKEEERTRLIAQQNELLEQQVADRTAKLEHSLNELKQTQAQLIQSEKMASLGELTAGIAHEIQNPLNFVNNFSDVSVELLQELKDEVEKGDLEEVNAIADDVILNLEKIAHHGRRADGIVKGMLQHSRTSTGQKELTDINTLADEFLRLAYHGLRAKDKSFNANLITNFGQGLPKINIIPQDVGRVLLNLFNNAFYATQEKSKQYSVISSQSQAPDSIYKPTVSISTQLKEKSLQIIVKDNGSGIPDAIKDKILQPFFTTKPTGEGTGLGLSLSYDIIVKSHGGSINIESTEGEGSEFKITLPIV